jgi:protein phosphatase
VRILVKAICDLGCVRKNNEDLILVGGELIRDARHDAAFELGAEDRLCLAVADGMGGMERGEEASTLVLERLRSQIAAMPGDLSDEELSEVLRVFAEETHRSLPADSGSTLVALLFYRGLLFRFHAGDSRLWLYRDGLLSRLTVDHSLREMGNKPEAPSNIIVNAFGGGQGNFLEFSSLGSDFRSGDRFLLSSDGLHDLLSPSEIGAILRANPDTAEEALLEAAKDRGGKDNISILFASLE